MNGQRPCDGMKGERTMWGASETHWKGKAAGRWKVEGQDPRVALTLLGGELEEPQTRTEWRSHSRTGGLEGAARREKQSGWKSYMLQASVTEMSRKHAPRVTDSRPVAAWWWGAGGGGWWGRVRLLEGLSRVTLWLC